MLPPHPASFALACAVLALVHPIPAVAAEPWTFDDSIALRKAHELHVSPDGTRVLWVVRELTADGSRWQGDLWLGVLATGEQRRLTDTAAEEDLPCWSADGRTIFFLSDRDSAGAGGGLPQVWSLPAAGGAPAARTTSPTGVSEYACSRDGGTIAYLAPVGPSPAARARAAAHDDVRVESERAANSRVWVTAAGGDAPVTADSVCVTSFTLSPDGREIVYAASASAGLDAIESTDLWSVPATGGPVRDLVRRPGMDDRPRFSPDGRWIAFLSREGDPTGWASDAYVCVVAASGGAARNLTPDFHDLSIGSNAELAPVWTSDSRSLLFVAPRRTNLHVFRAWTEPRAVEPVTHDDGVNESPSEAAGVIAWTHEDATHAATVRVRTARGGDRDLAELNPGARNRPAFAAEVVRWKSPDGREVEGLLYRPGEPRGAGPVPLLVYVHGGPAANHAQYFTPALDLMGRVEFLQEGWAVLLPNPRGSTGYGREWRLASTRDWAGLPYEDLMSGVNTLVARGIADPARLAVCGWSYGGFMAANVVTRTRRFRAAVAGAGPMDLFSMTGTSDVPQFTRFSMGAWPWDDPAPYLAQSPLLHAGAIRTPTAFAHGELDFRVSPTQSREMYRALRARGVPTDLLVMPRELHVPAEPAHFRALMRWSHEWLVRWTTGSGAAHE
ncbi:MAG: S9 family peptidase [Candidatus Eisenbacteria bacterium]